mgnify:FL=1
MPEQNGPVGSPSLTQPELPKKRARTRMKSILADPARARRAAKRAAARAIRKAAEPPKPPKPPVPKKEKLVPVTLGMRHSLNGVFIGPGTVMLTESKARRLLSTEYDAMAKETELTQNRAFILSFRNGVPVRREVPASRFDDILTREELPVGSTGGER